MDVSCDCHGTGLVEVKCPYKYRDIMPTDVKNDPQYCLEIKDNDVRILRTVTDMLSKCSSTCMSVMKTIVILL